MDNENRNEFNEETIIDGQILDEQTVEEQTAAEQTVEENVAAEPETQTTEEAPASDVTYETPEPQIDNGNAQYNNEPYGGQYNQQPTGQPNNQYYNNTYNSPKKKSGSKTAIIIACIAGTVSLICIFGLIGFGMLTYLRSNRSTPSNGNSMIAERPEDIDAKIDKKEEKAPTADIPIETTEPVSAAESEGGLYTATDVSGMVENVIPSVVSIVSTQSVEGYSFFGEKYKQEYDASGSGFIVGKNDSELLLATNNHVVENATAVQVTFVDDTSAEATVKGTDPKADLAVIAVKLEDLSSDTLNSIKIAVLGDSDSLKVGQAAIVIGNAQGMGQAVTVGCISAKNRERQIQDSTTGGSKTMKFIQTDAAINGGNSGGPLLDINGNVVGISTAKITDTQVEGMCFAIPISSAKPIINELMNRETIAEEDKGYLGVSFQNISSEAVQLYGVPDGVYVAKVTKGGPAEKAGIEVGDIITKIDSLEVNSADSASDKIQSNKAGTEIEIELYRPNATRTGYDLMTVTAKLATAEEIGINVDKGTDKGSQDAQQPDEGYGNGIGSDEQPGEVPGGNGNGNNGGSEDPNSWFEDMFPW